MKQGKILTGAALLLLLNACTEIGPAIDFGTIRAFDTTYTEAVPTPQSKVVLVEEYTGVECTNCPAAASILETYAASHPGKMISVGLHSGSLTAPIDKDGIRSKYDFRNDKVKSMMTSYYSEDPSKPASCFDRTKFETYYFSLNKNAWTSYIDQRGSQTPPVNIVVNSAYNEEKNQAVITVKVSYTKAIAQKQTMNVWIVEDKIVDAQLYPGTVDSAYEFHNVLRDFLTPSSGASFLTDVSSKAPGTVYERTFIYDLDNTWNIANCKIIAFVNNNEQDDKSVLQAAEANVK